MKIVSPYTHPQKWLKGNLHTHTTHSDGDMTLEDTVRYYAADGYDFLSITDHHVVSDVSGVDGGGMLLVPGEEVSIAEEPGPDCVHVAAIGIREVIGRLATAQEVIDATNAAGGIAIVAHPRWSRMTYGDFNALGGFAAFEVYNANCEKDEDKGLAADYWDSYMTAHRRAIWAVASDDTHEWERDFAGGWTYVNAEKKAESILAAIASGNAYASCGPRIETIRVENGTIGIYCSSARLVRFVTAGGYAVKRVGGEHVKQAFYTPQGDEVYVRAEVVGHDGSRAWTNPFFIEG